MKWFDQWKKYVNLDGQDESDTQEIYNPGPFDNSSILGKCIIFLFVIFYIFTTDQQELIKI